MVSPLGVCRRMGIKLQNAASQLSTYENAGAMMRRWALWSSPSAHTRPFPRTFATGGLNAGDFTVAMKKNEDGSSATGLHRGRWKQKKICRDVSRTECTVYASILYMAGGT